MSNQLAILNDNIETLTALMNLNAAPGTDVRTMALQEIQYVQERAMMNPSLLDCSPESILICVRKAIKNNLTLDPSAGLMYMIPGSVKGANGQYIKVLEAPLTVNGALSVAYQCGTILDHERPEVEYNEKGQAIACTVRILRPTFGGTRWETIVYDGVYFRKWMTASHKKNARGKQDADANSLNYANPLYRSHNGSIDPEFAIAKSLRHALEKLGTNPNAKRMQTIVIEQGKKVINEPEAEYAEEITGTFAPTMIVNPVDGNDL